MSLSAILIAGVVCKCTAIGIAEVMHSDLNHWSHLQMHSDPHHWGDLHMHIFFNKHAKSVPKAQPVASLFSGAKVVP